MGARVAGGVVMASLLAACATEQGPASPPSPQSDMTGRWMLSAPNAPACGMEFEGAPGQQSGTIRPEGGCPGNFFMSKRWTFTQDTLTIADEDNQPLAQLALGGGRFTGKSTDGLPVTLSR